MEQTNKIDKNADRLADFLFDKIFEIDDGSLDIKKAEQIFNGAGKWEKVVRLKMDYRQIKKIVGDIKQIEEDNRPYIIENKIVKKKRILENKPS